MDYTTAITYGKQVGLLTLSQLGIFLLPILILAVGMHFISKYTENVSYRLFGNGLFLKLFGFIGVPFHEIGHAVFAVIFRHKIHEVKLFAPNLEDGLLGYVSHSFNPDSAYQKIGRLFIGIGPVLLGSLLMFLLARLLLGSEALGNIDTSLLATRQILSLDTATGIITHLAQEVKQFMVFLLTGEIAWWRKLLFLYFAFAIGSSITLSPMDIQGAWRGGVFLVSFLLIINFLSAWAGNYLSEAFTMLSAATAVVSIVIASAAVINLMFLLLGGGGVIIKRAFRS